MNRRHFVIAVACAAPLLAWPAEAPADPLDETLRRVTKARAKLKTLKGSFKQKRVIGLLATEVDSRGKLLLVRPNRLRWELAPPDSVTYWMGPEGFAMATGDGVNKVGKGAAGRFAAVLGDLMTLLGGDLTTLRSRYLLSVTEPEGRFVLTAKPRKKKNPQVAKHVASLRMETGPELWTVQRIVIEERNGDQSIIHFDKLKRDVPIPAARMIPPAKR